MLLYYLSQLNSTQTKMKQSSEESITIQTQDISGGKHIRLYLEGGTGEYGGFIASDEPDRISPDRLWVRPDVRGRGLGEKLMRALLIEAQASGVKIFSGHVESQYALDIRARIFGKNAIKFFDDGDSGDPEIFHELYNELPITYEQAKQSLERSEQYEDDSDYRSHGFSVEIDMTAFNNQTHETKKIVIFPQDQMRSTSTSGS